MSTAGTVLLRLLDTPCEASYSAGYDDDVPRSTQQQVLLPVALWQGGPVVGVGAMKQHDTRVT